MKRSKKRRMSKHECRIAWALALGLISAPLSAATTYQFGTVGEDGTSCTLTIADGETYTYAYGNYGSSKSYDSSYSSGNSVLVTGGTITYLYGGISSTGGVTGNSVTIKGGTVSSATYGGYSAYDSAVVSDNRVIISEDEEEGTSPTVKGTVYGNASYSGTATTSEDDVYAVTITGGTISASSVYGGWSSAGSSVGNTVYVTGGSFTNSSLKLAGGYVGTSASGSASDNSLIITGGTFAGYLYGGYAYSSGDVTGNVVDITGGSVTNTNTKRVIAGGYTNSGSAIGNYVKIDGATISNKTGYIYGGYATGAVSSGNSVTITNAEITSDVYGNWSTYNALGVDEDEVLTTAVTISDSTVSGNIWGGYSSSGATDTPEVSYNYVIITGSASDDESTDEPTWSTTVKNVVGGQSYAGSSTVASVVGNEVSITDSEVTGYVYGGYAYIGTVSKNRVCITGGSVGSYVYGGYQSQSSSVQSYVSGNTVTIVGAEVSGNIAGAYSNYSDAYNNSVDFGDAEDGGVSTTASQAIYGAYVTNSDYYAKSNTVTVNGVVSYDEDGDATYSTYAKFVYGARTYSGEASGNSVSISGSYIAGNGISTNKSASYGSVWGARSNGNGNVINNTVEINNSYLGSHVFGGASIGEGTSSGNSVSLTDSSASRVYGNYATTGNATGTYTDDEGSEKTATAVTISGSSVSYVYGGYVYTSGDVAYNEVGIIASSVSYDVYGGYSKAGNAENNEVTITGTVTADDEDGLSYSSSVSKVYGGSTADGDATGNKASVSGTEVTSSIYGGYASNTASLNSVSVIDSKVCGSTYGNFASTGDALGVYTDDDGNEVTVDAVYIENCTISYAIYGGMSTKGKAEGNTVTIVGTATDAGGLDGTYTSSVGGYVYGGYTISSAGDVLNNTVAITGSSVGTLDKNSEEEEYDSSDGYVYGGYSKYSEADSVTVSGNTVKMEDSQANFVWGGRANGSNATVSGNSVSLEKCIVYEVYAGEGHGGGTEQVVIDNELTVSGGTVLNAAIGGLGYGENGTITANSVTLSGEAEVGNDFLPAMVAGGYAYKGGTVMGNTVTIESGNVNGYVFGNYVNEGYSGDVSGVYYEEEYDEDGNCTGTSAVTTVSVTIESGTVTLDVYGGYTPSGDAYANSVVIEGGTIEGAVIGNYTGYGNATGIYDDDGNTVTSVTMTGGTAGYVIGGYSLYGSADSNSVELENAEVASDVYGGWSDDQTSEAEEESESTSETESEDADETSRSASYNSVSVTSASISGSLYGGYSAAGDASGNSVYIGGDVTVSGAVYGGCSDAEGDVSLNELAVAGKDSSAETIVNFDTITFDVSGLSAGDVMLTLTGESITDLGEADISISDGLEDVGVLAVGEEVTLISAAAGYLDTSYVDLAELSEDYSGLEYSYSEEDGSVSGTYDMLVTTEEDDSDNVTAIVLVGDSNITVTGLTLDMSSVSWNGDALLSLESGLEYDFSDISSISGDSSEAVISDAGTVINVGSSTVIMDGESAASVSGLSDGLGEYDYSYELADGAVTITGTGSVVSSDSDLYYSISAIGTISFGTIAYDPDNALVTLDCEETYDLSDVSIDVEDLSLTGLSDGYTVEGGYVLMTLIASDKDAGLDDNESLPLDAGITVGYELSGTENTSLLEGTLFSELAVESYSLVLRSGTDVTVTGVELDISSLVWGGSALLALESVSYDFSEAGLELSGEVCIEGISGTLLNTGETTLLIDGSGAAEVTDLDDLVFTSGYSYSPAEGVTVTGEAAAVTDSEGTTLSLEIDSISKITFGEIVYDSEDALLTLDGTYDLSDTEIDVSGLTLVDSGDIAFEDDEDDSVMVLIDAGGSDTGLSTDEPLEGVSVGYILYGESGDYTGSYLRGTMGGQAVITDDYDLAVIADWNVSVTDLSLVLPENVAVGDPALLILSAIDYTFDEDATDAEISSSFTVEGVSGTLLSEDTELITLIDGSAASGVTGLDTVSLTAEYEYTPADGVTVSGTAVSVEDENGTSLVLGIGSIDTISFGEIAYDADNAVLTLDSSGTYDLSETVIDVETLSISGIDALSSSDCGEVLMTLIDSDADIGLSDNESVAATSGIELDYSLSGTGESELTGTVPGGIEVDTYSLVLKAGTDVTVCSVTLDTAELDWDGDALLTLSSGLTYDFSSVSSSDTETFTTSSEVSLSTTDFLDVDSATLLVDGSSSTVIGMDGLEGAASTYSYSLSDGAVEVSGTALTSLNGTTDSLYYKVSSIDTLDFYITSETSTDTAMLYADSANLSGTAISAYAKGGSYLSEGYSVTLLDTANGITTDDSTTYYGTVTEGVSVEYDLEITNDGEKLTATLGKASLREETKSITETRLGMASIVDQGQDNISYLLDAGVSLVGASMTWMPFATMSASSLSYDTGSSVDIDGFNASVGLIRNIPVTSGRLTLGASFQYGRGEYDSYASGVYASGDTDYVGAMVMLKHTWDSGTYVEGSVSAGYSQADYGSSTLLDGTVASYDVGSAYWGVHVGFGREYDLSEGRTLNVYGKYFYSHLESSTATISTGEAYSFDGIDSSRIRIGARFSRNVWSYGGYYVGAAYQYQFKDDARATYNGMSTLTPSLQGSSGMLEAGIKVTPKSIKDLTVDLGVTGWAGKQKGVEGSLKLKWDI